MHLESGGGNKVVTGSELSDVETMHGYNHPPRSKGRVT